MARLWRFVAATIAVFAAGGLAGCGGSGGSGSGGGVAATPPTSTTSAPPARSPQQGANCSRTSVGFTPLTDLGRRSFRGFEGGLYPGGRNTPPRSYLDAGLRAAAQVRPLAADGAPSPSGRIVLMSIGMSNASREFTALVREAAADHALTPRPAPPPQVPQSGGLLARVRQSEASLLLEKRHVMLVNGAFPNYDAETVVHSEQSYLTILHTDLADAGVTANQVQAVWLLEAIANEQEPFPTDARHLERDLNTILAMLTAHFPNLRLVYISSRIYGGYAVSSLNPEPYAYDSGFAVKWTVAGRMANSRTRPWVAWGPYTWADGTHARSDGLTWTCSDFGPDGTHPSIQGAFKVAHMLLGFFTTSPTARTWFGAPSR